MAKPILLPFFLIFIVSLFLSSCGDDKYSVPDTDYEKVKTALSGVEKNFTKNTLVYNTKLFTNVPFILCVRFNQTESKRWRFVFLFNYCIIMMFILKIKNVGEMMNNGDKFKVTIESFDINGYGVCHINNQVVFVEGALEGEECEIKLTNVHKKYSFSVATKIIKSSPNRILSLEEFNDLSGECDLAHIDYDTELKIKELKVKNTLRGLEYKFNPIIKSDKIYNYRNKIMMPFGKDNDEVVYGFYKRNSHDIIDIKNDIMSSEIDNKILYLIKRYLVLFNVPIYDEKTLKGIFRSVMIRHTCNNDYMIVLILTINYDFKRLVEILTNEIKEIKSIYLNINSKNTNVILSDEYILLYGDKIIKENILGLDFEVYPQSFMQVNHDQCEKLYTEAIRMANLKSNMNVIDAYCGMGSITLNVAKKVNKVYGIEIVPEAIKNANTNKLINKIDNVEFICGPCENEIIKLTNKEKIDLIIFDPPRKGCDINFLNTVISMNIPKIVYVSCNISTAKRDIDILMKNNYALEEVTPCDMFSRTSHVETILLLTKKQLKKPRV
ncbi:MAG: 23S rRNA (uracil(1939)-C(5))-methyltransferase RlmD [Acholeplasmatales bacterium]|nr:23S rRNA (uracil(1939)-C(5))-methyltransferase RlmD [Acholeplasmatales bacterium]